MTESELRGLGWRTFFGIVTAFLTIPVPILFVDFDGPKFEKFAAYVGASVLFIAWVALIAQISKRLWRL